MELSTEGMIFHCVPTVSRRGVTDKEKMGYRKGRIVVLTEYADLEHMTCDAPRVQQ